MPEDDAKQTYLNIINICLSSAKNQQASADPSMKDYFDGFIRGIEFIKEQIEK